MYLYLLKFKDGERFKIGVANSLQDRIVSLGAKHFDLAASFYVSGEEGVIKKLERQLHTDFAPFQTQCNSLTSGNTEVFYINALEGVLEEIHHKAARFPHHKLEVHHGITFSRAVTYSSSKPLRTRNASPPSLRFEAFGVEEFAAFLAAHATNITAHITPDHRLVAIDADCDATYSAALPSAKAYWGRKRISNIGSSYTYGDGTLHMSIDCGDINDPGKQFLSDRMLKTLDQHGMSYTAVNAPSSLMQVAPKSFASNVIYAKHSVDDRAGQPLS